MTDSQRELNKSITRTGLVGKCAPIPPFYSISSEEREKRSQKGNFICVPQAQFLFT